MNKKVAIVGAGPGGLTAGVILSSKGYSVDIYEKQDCIGGRNSSFDMAGFKFDLGPTFLMMKFVLEEIFQIAGRNIEDYLEIREIDPLYRLVLPGGQEFYPTRDTLKMKSEMDKHFPGAFERYEEFLVEEKKKFDVLIPCLQIPYDSFADFFKGRFIKALPRLDAHKSLFDHLGRYFDDEILRLAFTFQAKYLGMSPWECPGTFSIISYIEHGGGIYHPIGGLNQISKAMARIIEENGGNIHLSSPIEEIEVNGKRAQGLRLQDGETVNADYIVLNADFSHAMKHLVSEDFRPKYTDKKLEGKRYSCSTFMLYLGIEGSYSELPHHNILFANDYRSNIEDISKRYEVSDDPSIYVQNASVTDTTLAPEGKSSIYILVPVPNNNSDFDWESGKEKFRDKVIKIVEERGGFKDLGKRIVEERIITPFDWENEKSVYKGATFNLAHNIAQMLVFRPHNRFEEFANCYLVGGGTHPGSGLPTIYESGKISSRLIIEDGGEKAGF
ncbi:phytoene desaturase [Peptoclostridium litorale DSM 5388]|uniref:Zeta-carotene-forming phytoene desaturase CarA n=1 Tax=Peptoclostridium litorale DSM 5388 TaxID=1121324 RepID=A0A069REW9_PEPLI|nr:phytoene desaturase family protein [Peptoclostridium litorale]KDR93916.1 zeta-carotene-forming phytoene desaturase CarA [Peptoclostridium litorale DSM 5388]KDR95343.1 zeta-carotene-forming phytoene desaturase CarA [Peptoclostridium litorale DSM 5388]SIN88508.1 phytoene desaturase [Peptoclostridium litorale DSM 5388]